MCQQARQRTSNMMFSNGNSSSSSSDDGGCLVEVRHPNNKPGHGAFGHRRHHHNHAVSGNRPCHPSSTSRRPQASQRHVCSSEAEAALLHHNWLLQGQLGQLHWQHACCEAELHRTCWLLHNEHAAHQAAQAQMHQEHQLRVQAQAAQAAAEHACWEADQGRAGCVAQLREAEATINRLQEEAKALQAAAGQQQAAAATALDWPPTAVKIVPARWPGNATLEQENAQLKAQVAELKQALQAHSAEETVLREEDSCSYNPAAEVAAFKAKWASPDSAQSCDEDDDDNAEEVVVGLQAAVVEAQQRGLLASDVVPAVTEVMEEQLWSGYDAFDRQAPAVEQQQAQAMAAVLGSVHSAAQDEEQDSGFWDAPVMADSTSSSSGSDDDDDSDSDSDLLSDLAAMQGQKQQALLAPAAARAEQAAAPAAAPAPALVPAGGAAGGVLHDDLWYVEEAIVADNLKHMQQLRAFTSGLAALGLKF